MVETFQKGLHDSMAERDRTVLFEDWSYALTMINSGESNYFSIFLSAKYEKITAAGLKKQADMVVLGVERIYKFVPGKELYLREMKLNSREVEMTFQWKDERIRSLPLDKEDLRAIRLQMAGLF